MLRRYAFTWCYLGVFLLMEIVRAALTPGARSALSAWASTSVANLEHNPVGTLLISVFIGNGDYAAWPFMIFIALFAANHTLGNVRTALICLAGQVVGSLVSEGIVAYRVHAGQLPVADRHLIDVGPSYVVLSAIVIALVCGAWPARLAAAGVLAIMVFIGDIFGGLSNLDVAAVGHLTAAITALLCTLPIALRRFRAAPPSPSSGPSPSN